MYSNYLSLNPSKIDLILIVSLSYLPSSFFAQPIFPSPSAKCLSTVCFLTPPSLLPNRSHPLPVLVTIIFTFSAVSGKQSTSPQPPPLHLFRSFTTQIFQHTTSCTSCHPNKKPSTKSKYSSNPSHC